VSHHTIFISACAQNVRLQQERKRVDADVTLLTDSTVNNCVTQSGSFADDASFQFVDIRDLGTIDSLLKHTPRCSQ